MIKKENYALLVRTNQDGPEPTLIFTGRVGDENMSEIALDTYNCFG